MEMGITPGVNNSLYWFRAAGRSAGIRSPRLSTLHAADRSGTNRGGSRLMSTATSRSTTRVALIGNPNTGKSTLFNALSGVHQRVANYPGVTVEKKMGHFRTRATTLNSSTCRALTASHHARRMKWWPSMCCLVVNRANRFPMWCCRLSTRQLAAESLPVEPGAFVGPADGGRAQHDRHRQGSRHRNQRGRAF